MRLTFDFKALVALTLFALVAIDVCRTDFSSIRKHRRALGRTDQLCTRDTTSDRLPKGKGTTIVGNNQNTKAQDNAGIGLNDKAASRSSASIVGAKKGDKVCSIVDYGAKPGDDDIGPAINDAFTKCILGGRSGTLLIPEGKWTLSSHVKLAKGSDYTVQWDGIVTLPHDEKIGGGPMFQIAYAERMLFTGTGSFLGGGAAWRANGLHSNRPRLVNFFKVKDSEVTGVHLDDAPMYFLGLNECSGMKVHDMVLSSRPPFQGTTDGVDVMCTDCEIYNMDVTNGDDSVVIKSPSKNVRIHNITVHGGFGIGIGSVGKTGRFDVSNIYASNIKVIDGGAGVYIKSYASAGGIINNVTMENFDLSNVAKPIAIDAAWQGGSLDTSATASKEGGGSKLVMSNFHFRNFKGTGDATTRPIVKINGASSATTRGMLFENIDVKKLGAREIKFDVQNACGSGLPGLKPCSGGGGGGGEGGGSLVAGGGVESGKAFQEDGGK